MANSEPIPPGMSAEEWASECRRWDALTPTQQHAETWPECSGFPQSCPENDGHGCCKGNQTVLIDVSSAREALHGEGGKS